MKKMDIKSLEKRIVLFWRVILVMSLSIFLVTAVRFTSAVGRNPEPKSTKPAVNVQEERLANLLRKEVTDKVTKNKHVKLKNAGTNHIYLVEKRGRPEKMPDLSTSTLTGQKGGDGIIRYTMVLKNTGNTHATDIDVFNELDGRLSEPTKFTFLNCGKNKINSSKEGVVDLSNIFVGKGEKCIIQYETSLSGEGLITNALYISPAMEGGEEIGPIEEVLIFESDSPSVSAPVIENPEIISEEIVATPEEEVAPVEVEPEVVVEPVEEENLEVLNETEAVVVLETEPIIEELIEEEQL